MYKNNILLSTGSVLWMSLKHVIPLAIETGFNGIEVVPTKIIINEKINPSSLGFIKGIHHNWRLDIGQDSKYGINKFTSLVFILIRFIFFPSVFKSRTFLQRLSKNINCPVTVHNISSLWTRDNNQSEFEGGILYEIMNIEVTPKTLKKWLSHPNHHIVVDTRDDQSLIWAKKYGFNTWQEFWKWIGLKKIKNLQLTLIGIKGIINILRHEKSLAEEQLLWLNKRKWVGNITVEVNPLILFFLLKGDIKKGFKIISQFAKQTLIEGKKWSI